MIHLPASVRVYLCLSPCDMRRSFDGLHALVRDHLQLDAFAGHLYLFANKRRDRVKILYWDRDGFAIWSKRLEEGSDVIPRRERPRTALRDHRAGAWSLAERHRSAERQATKTIPTREPVSTSENISKALCFYLEAARFRFILIARWC